MMNLKSVQTFFSVAAANAVMCSLAFAEEGHLSLTDKEQLVLQRELSWLTALMWSMVVILLLLAVAIRYIARRTTHPCRWCMEFIPNSATVCPRCGKTGKAVVSSR